MIAVHFENLLFLLLLAVAFLFQLLTRAVSKASRSQTKRTPTSTPEMPPPIPRPPAESDAERIRKFLEALGQPPTSRPPPSVLPRTDIPPRPVAPVQPPPGPFSMPRRLTPEERRKRHVILHEAAATTPPVFEVQQHQAHIEAPGDIQSPAEASDTQASSKTKGAGARTEIAALLRSPAGLRNAIILREIFGPPRAMQPRELGT